MKFVHFDACNEPMFDRQEDTPYVKDMINLAIFNPNTFTVTVKYADGTSTVFYPNE